MNSKAPSTTRIRADFLLVGGGIAAATAAQTLRDEDAAGSIVMLCEEPLYPYNRPPLTGGIVTGDLRPVQVLVRRPEDYRGDDIDVHLNTEARSVDLQRRCVLDQHGNEYEYGKLLIATGSVARRLAVPGADLPGILQLRTLADALALRHFALRGKSVVIIGTSFIGMETASSLAQLGLAVTLIDVATAVFPTIRSPNLATFFLERCKKHGIKVRLGQSVVAFRGADRVREVVTNSGDVLACDAVVLAIGVAPRIDFLSGSGLLLEDGVLVDEFLRTNDQNVFAAGDVADCLDHDGKRWRAEHWDNARQQGRVAARNMLGDRVLYEDVPHYFCDFLDMSFTFLGRSKEAERRVARGNIETGSFAEFYIRGNRIVGLFSTGRPAEEIRTIDTLIRQQVDIGGAIRQLADANADLGFLARATVLILQGGGALGAFECGVVRAMEEAEIFPDIVGGVSVGALNGAIIAANPRHAFEALEAFWSELSVEAPPMSADLPNAFAVWNSALLGIPGFFRPRWLSPPLPGEIFPSHWTSLYDTEPLTHLLKKYVDFARLATSPVRLIIGAVDVERGELNFFDSRIDELTPQHIVASCSLPAIFPWTTIEGRHYWDGGIISNSPLEHVLSTTGADHKDVIIVDLFPGKRPLPANLAEVATRCEEIIYGERVRNDAHVRELLHDYQALVAEIMASVDRDTAKRLKERPRYVHLMGRGATTSITRIVRNGGGHQPPGMDYDFSAETIARHKQDGYRLARRRLPSKSQRPCVVLQGGQDATPVAAKEELAPAEEG